MPRLTLSEQQIKLAKYRMLRCAAVHTCSGVHSWTGRGEVAAPMTPGYFPFCVSGRETRLRNAVGA